MTTHRSVKFGNFLQKLPASSEILRFHSFLLKRRKKTKFGYEQRPNNPVKIYCRLTCKMVQNYCFQVIQVNNLRIFQRKPVKKIFKKSNFLTKQSCLQTILSFISNLLLLNHPSRYFERFKENESKRLQILPFS